MKVRIKFAKYGVMKYIGHLDIMRYFQKCMRKANIDIAYTEGFSPHQIMSFASPLGVGIESCGEYFDIELKSGDSNGVKNALNDVMVPGMDILSVKKLDDKTKNAMASIAAASYEVYVKEGCILDCTDNLRIDEFLGRESINIIKTTKKQELEFDLKPHIYNFEFDKTTYKMVVDASSAGNIKPLMVIGEYVRFCGYDFNEERYQIKRTETYTVNENGELVSLESVGEDF